VISLYSVVQLTIGTSFNADKCVKVKDYAPDNQPIVFVVGAMAHGRVSIVWPYVATTVSLLNGLCSIFRCLLIIQRKILQ
jgi:hypothetical protein